ncbi:hypothetical protein STIAU_4534, partial [Stigmatella aurantiaca DW4/3-1]
MSHHACLRVQRSQQRGQDHQGAAGGRLAQDPAQPAAQGRHLPHGRARPGRRQPGGGAQGGRGGARRARHRPAQDGARPRHHRGHRHHHAPARHAAGRGRHPGGVAHRAGGPGGEGALQAHPVRHQAAGERG